MDQQQFENLIHKIHDILREESIDAREVLAVLGVLTDDCIRYFDDKEEILDSYIKTLRNCVIVEDHESI